MAEITTPALRRLIREFSADAVLYTEMLSAAAIVRGGYHNEPRVTRYPFDDSIVFQIAGNDAAVMADACSWLCERGCSDIDINMGCAAPDILKKGYGAALLRDTGKALEVVKKCREKTTGSLSVKLRTGFDSHDLPWLTNLCLSFQDAGVDRITVHGRHAKQVFRRTADWNIIRSITETLSIPVTGNGDITDPALALKRLKQSGCDSIMIGREAARSPWIFRSCSELARTGKSDFTVNLRDVFIRGLEYTRDMLPVEFHKSRGHRFSFYFSGNLAFGHGLFARIRHTDSIDGMIAHVSEYFETNPSEVIKNVSPVIAGL